VTIALLIYAVVMTVGFAGIAYPRTRRLFLTAPPKEEPKLLAASAGSPLAEWKTIFRDTVVAVDGGLTPEMEAFLVSDEVAKVRETALAKHLLDEARERAKKELDELLDGDDARKRLDGSAYKEFAADFNSSASVQEKLNVARRWHEKGYRFADDLREHLLQHSSPNESWRNAYRKMFDEQDEDDGDEG
jgi:hypothetical protein